MASHLGEVLHGDDGRGAAAPWRSEIHFGRCARRQVTCAGLRPSGFWDRLPEFSGALGYRLA